MMLVALGGLAAGLVAWGFIRHAMEERRRQEQEDLQRTLTSGQNVQKFTAAERMLEWLAEPYNRRG